MSLGHALYYPHINLTNKNWIKHALLFWDKLSRIVPESIEPSDNEDIIRIKSETDFIIDYQPDHYDTSRAFKEFSHDLIAIMESDTYLNEKLMFHNSFSRGHRYRNLTLDNNERRRFFSELVKSTGTYIHVEKLDDRLKNYLFETGIAIPGRNQWSDWVKIDNEIGLLYMTYFAKVISKDKSLAIVTDVEQSFSASIQFESKINSDYRPQFEYRLGNLLIDTVVPKNINDVPIDKLIEIRNKYSSERDSFFNEISKIANSVTGMDNINNLTEALNYHSKLILEETKKLEKFYSISKIDTIKSFLSISIPTSFVALNDHVPDYSKPLFTAGGIVFGIIAAANSVKKEKLRLSENPKSYLLNVKSELSGGGIFTRVNDTVKGIRKW